MADGKKNTVFYPEEKESSKRQLPSGIIFLCKDKEWMT